MKQASRLARAALAVLLLPFAGCKGGLGVTITVDTPGEESEEEPLTSSETTPVGSEE